ncbi:MAG: hypothetical protein ACQKBT_12810, partial [Puniceicoccales bacterium]
MIPIALLSNWLLRFLGADVDPSSAEFWFGFEGIDRGWGLLLAGLATWWVLRSYRDGFGRLRGAQRFTLVGLRLAWIYLLLFILLMPVVRVTEEETIRGTLLILQDASESMAIRDTRTSEEDVDRVRIAMGDSGDPQPSRRELIEAVVANPDINLLGRLADKVDLVVSPFGRGAGAPRNLSKGGNVP